MKLRWKRIAWIPGEILHSAHLTGAFDALAEALKKDYYGWKNFKLEVLNGMLYIRSCQCFFPDGSIVDFNNEYELSFNLESLTRGTNLYLQIVGDNEQFENTSTFSGEIVSSCFLIPKMQIVTTGGILITKAIWSNMWQISQFRGRILNFQESVLQSQIVFLCKRINECFFTEKDKMDKDNVFISNLCLAHTITAVAMNHRDCFQVYQSLCTALGLVAWKAGELPFIPYFDYDNCEEIIESIIKKILSYMDLFTSTAKMLHWKEEKDFIISIENIKSTDTITIVCDIESEKAMNLLRIASESCWKKAQQARSIGLQREKIAPSIWRIKFDNDFFKNDERIICDSSIATMRCHFYIS